MDTLGTGQFGTHVIFAEGERRRDVALPLQIDEMSWRHAVAPLTKSSLHLFSPNCKCKRDCESLERERFFWANLTLRPFSRLLRSRLAGLASRWHNMI